jgi:hypothetical protein
MSVIQIEPPPSTERPTTALRRLSGDQDTRSIQVGVLATLFLHLLLYFLGPHVFEAELVPLEVERKSEPDPFNIVLEEPEVAVPEAVEAPPPYRFVEVNPDAPDNEPDETPNFGAQNQQAAQEVPTPNGDSDRPATEGETDISSTQIVDGQLRDPEIPVPSSPEAQPEAVVVATAPPPEQNPLTGFEEAVGEDPEGVGTRVNPRFVDGADMSPEQQEGAPDAPQTQEVFVAVPIDRNNPQPRPSVTTRNTRPAVFEEYLTGTANLGPIAYDAKWNNYGQYLQRLIDAVQLRWDGIVSRSGFYPSRGSRVAVTFVLNRAGEIASIRSVEGTAGDVATNWCVAAISPFEGFTYGEWTDDMIALLGAEQEMTFMFLYR